MPPTDVNEDDSAIGVMCTDVFGPNWKHFRIAHMSTGDRIGVELFQFDNQENPADNFEYWKTGVFHFCVQDPNLEELAEKIVAAGGKKRMKEPRYYYPGEKPYRMSDTNRTGYLHCSETLTSAESRRGCDGMVGPFRATTTQNQYL